MWLAAAAENESRGLSRQVPTSPEPPAFFPDAGGLLLPEWLIQGTVEEVEISDGESEDEEDGDG